MKILLPVDHSEASREAVQFVGRLFGPGQADREGLTITLLHVGESLPDSLLALGEKAPAGSPHKQVIDDWQAAIKHDGARLLQERKRDLIDAGVPDDVIGTKLIAKESRPGAKKVVAVLTIIDEMKQGDYTVVCLGRRGTTAAGGSFLGSVAEKVLREAQGKTVWVVD